MGQRSLVVAKVCVDGTGSDTELTTVAPFPILDVKSSHYFKKAGLKRETKKINNISNRMSSVILTLVSQRKTTRASVGLGCYTRFIPVVCSSTPGGPEDTALTMTVRRHFSSGSPVSVGNTVLSLSVCQEFLWEPQPHWGP